jgi:hypothetical protein
MIIIDHCVWSERALIFVVSYYPGMPQVGHQQALNTAKITTTNKAITNLECDRHWPRRA